MERIYQEGALFPGVADSLQRGIRSNDCAMSLAFSRKVAYAAPAFALAVVGIPVYIYVPKFYTDVVGVNIGMLGFLLLADRPLRP